MLNPGVPSSIDFESPGFETVTLQRSPTVSVVRGTVMWLYASTDKRWKMCVFQSFPCDDRPERDMRRAIAIVTREGMLSPEVGYRLAQSFLPDESAAVQYMPFKPGWPPALYVSQARWTVPLVEPTRPGKN